MRSVVIIPARMTSNRLPGKPMIEVAGKPLIQWAYDQAYQSKADHVLVATSDREISRYCLDHGMKWRPTRDDHPTGTHRCAEVAAQFKEDSRVDVVVNWQSDEVEANPEDVNRLIDLTYEKERICTLVGPLEPSWLDNPNVTKAVCFEKEGNLIAHWFSRASMAASLAHVGIYAFPFWALKSLSRLPPSPYSLAESLEQLTWIEESWPIGALEVDKVPLAINTPEDLKQFERKKSCLLN